MANRIMNSKQKQIIWHEINRENGMNPGKMAATIQLKFNMEIKIILDTSMKAQLLRSDVSAINGFWGHQAR